MAVNFTSDDALKLLKAIFGNRPLKVYEGRNLQVREGDVVLHPQRDKYTIYNVIASGRISGDITRSNLVVAYTGGVNQQTSEFIWEYLGYNKQTMTNTNWTKLVFVGPDGFRKTYTQEGLRATGQLSTDTPRNHVAVTPNPARPREIVWIFDYKVNFQGTSLHAYIGTNILSD